MKVWPHHGTYKVVRGSPLLTPCLLLLTTCIALPATSSAGCGGLFTAQTGVLTSPGYPEMYPENQDCVYIIQRPEGEIISLAFHELHLEEQEECSIADYLEIRDGDTEASPLRKSLCGSDAPSDLIKSFSNALWIRFYSDSSLTAAGFKVTYTAAPVVKEQFFLVAASQTILIIHAGGGGTMALPIPGLYLPGALEFDPLQRRLYWADHGIGEIRSAFLNGTDWKTVFVNQLPDDYSGSLALDPMARLLFISETKRGRIVMTSLLTGHHRTVLSGLSTVFSIVLDQSQGIMFWVESHPPSISRASYDGSGRRKIVSRHLSPPLDLALDRAHKRLYWVNTDLQKVEWSDYEGKGRSSQVEFFKNTFFVALALTDDHLHLVDWGAQGVKTKFSIFRQMDKDGSNLTRNYIFFSRAEDILFHDSSTWSSDGNGCAGGPVQNGGCSHFCLPVDGLRHVRCLCPDGHVPSADRKSCWIPSVSHSENKNGARTVRYYFNDDEEDEDDDDDWDEYDDDEEEIAQVLQNGKTTTTTGSQTYRNPSTKTSPGQNARSPPNPDLTMYTSDDQTKQPSIVISKDDPNNRPITAEVHLTGPRPFDTDGSKVMRIACVYEGTAVTVWTGCGRGLVAKDDVCLMRPKVPDDDGKVIICQAYLMDGSYGFSSFTIQLNYPPQTHPGITGYTSGQVLRVGDSLRMKCRVWGGRPLVSAVDFSCPGHLDTEPDTEQRTHVQASVTIDRLTSSDDGITCVCSAEWKVPEMYTEKAYVTLRVTTEGRAGGLGTEEL